MTTDIALVLSLLLAATVLFAFEWLAIDLVTLLLLASLVLLGILTPAQAFSGFASEIIVILGSVFVISGALVKTGIMEWTARGVSRLAGKTEGRIVGVVMLLGAGVSAFLSNTSSTAVLAPTVLELSRRVKVSASRILMPLAYASILGGTCTLIGTSTNIAASGLFEKSGLRPISMFEFTPIGLVLAGVGILYLWTFGRRLLPSTPTEALTDAYLLQEYLSEVVVPNDSPLVGKALREAPLAKNGIGILVILRAGKKLRPLPDSTLQADDTLIVRATKEGLLAIKQNSGLQLHADVHPSMKDLVHNDLRISEAIVVPQSSLIGRSIRHLDFRRRFGASVLAVYRRGHAYPSKFQDVRLRAGDVLLLQGTAEDFHFLRGNPELWGLTEEGQVPGPAPRGLPALLVLITAIALGSTHVLPLSIALLLAALAMVLMRCISMEEAYEFVEWRLLILIAGMTSFGLAMESTRAADFLATWIVNWAAPLGMPVVMFTLTLLTMLLTQPMSNAAAALVILPVAISTAEGLGVDPRSFAILVTLAASLSFIAPFEPACLIVYGPGKYRFRDFLRTGAPLTLAVLVLLVWLVPVFWPLQ